MGNLSWMCTWIWLNRTLPRLITLHFSKTEWICWIPLHRHCLCANGVVPFNWKRGLSTQGCSRSDCGLTMVLKQREIYKKNGHKCQYISSIPVSDWDTPLICKILLHMENKKEKRKIRSTNWIVLSTNVCSNPHTNNRQFGHMLYNCKNDNFYVNKCLQIFLTIFIFIHRLLNYVYR